MREEEMSFWGKILHNMLIFPLILKWTITITQYAYIKFKLFKIRINTSVDIDYITP